MHVSVGRQGKSGQTYKSPVAASTGKLRIDSSEAAEHRQRPQSHFRPDSSGRKERSVPGPYSRNRRTGAQNERLRRGQARRGYRARREDAWQQQENGHRPERIRGDPTRCTGSGGTGRFGHCAEETETNEAVSSAEKTTTRPECPRWTRKGSGSTRAQGDANSAIYWTGVEIERPEERQPTQRTGRE